MEIGGIMNKQKSVLFNLLLLAGILVFINMVSITIFHRLDFSKGKIYSLSKASKNAVKGLDDRILVKAFFTKNLPGEFADARRFTSDILAEYQAYSRGKLRYEFVDPADEQELKDEAQKYQIHPMNLRTIENDKFEMREVYMGLVFMYRGKSEVIPFVQKTQGLEYDITSNIKKITSQGLKKVAFYDSSGGEVDPALQMQGIQGYYATAKELLSGNYELQEVDLKSEIDISNSMLIFTGVEESLEESQLYNLDQYLMKGGNILLLQERVKASLQEQTAEANESNLFQLLSHYGINIKNNLVTDAECGTIQVQTQQGFFRMATPMQYPFMPVINSVNADHLITKNQANIQLIFASEIDSTKTLPGNHFEPLLFTSAHSGETKPPRLDININQFRNINLKNMLQDGPKIVAGIFSGIFPSYFANSSEFKDGIPESADASIIVIPDSDFIKEGAGGTVKGNLNFFLNSVDFLAGESALIQIRSREIEYTPLKELENSQRKIVKWLNILLPSFLLILFGIIRYQKELKRRKLIGELYE
jgi:gliding-associated putative ABC transporter substrate-binding component GldG